MTQKQHSQRFKFTAFLLVLTVSVTSVYTPSSYALPETSLPRHGTLGFNPIETARSLRIPEELGSVRDVFVPEIVGATPRGRPIEDGQAQGPAPTIKINRLVVLLQNAHQNFDSESNVSKIIHWFEEKYQLPLVLLEGGEGRLDNLFFRALPDQKLKEQITEEYLKAGDLQGGEAASILSGNLKTQYYGIESENLYRQNKDVFLRVMAKEKEIFDALEKQETEMREKAKHTLSLQAAGFMQQVDDFHGQKIDLVAYVQSLERIAYSLPAGRQDVERIGKAVNGLSAKRYPLSADQYPELSKLLDSAENEKSISGAEYDIAMNELIVDWKTYVGAIPRGRPMHANNGQAQGPASTNVNISKQDQIDINRMIQEYQTGRLHAGVLVRQIEKLTTVHSPQTAENNLLLTVDRGLSTITIPEILKSTVTHAQTIESIKGTKLFDELKQLEDFLRKTLPQSPEEKNLLQDFKQLELLKSFAKLEITHEEWQEIAFGVERVADRTNLSILNAKRYPLYADHFRFYELATRRDKTLFDNALSVMDKENAPLAVIATGGFHEEGLTRELKSQNIPYVVVAPNIDSIDSKDNYMNAMQGKRSFMKYFKGSLWDALAKDYITKIVSTDHRPQSTENDLLLTVDRGLSTTLKRWRDRIIQDAVSEERVADAGKFTKYIDDYLSSVYSVKDKNEVRSTQYDVRGIESAIDDYFTALEQSLLKKGGVLKQGIKELWKQDKITAESVRTLIDRVQNVPASSLAADLVMIPGVPASSFSPLQPARSELRLNSEVVGRIDAALAILNKENLKRALIGVTVQRIEALALSLLDHGILSSPGFLSAGIDGLIEYLDLELAFPRKLTTDQKNEIQKAKQLLSAVQRALLDGNAMIQSAVQPLSLQPSHLPRSELRVKGAVDRPAIAALAGPKNPQQLLKQLRSSSDVSEMRELIEEAIALNVDPEEIVSILQKKIHPSFWRFYLHYLALLGWDEFHAALVLIPLLPALAVNHLIFSTVLYRFFILSSMFKVVLVVMSIGLPVYAVFFLSMSLLGGWFMNNKSIKNLRDDFKDWNTNIEDIIETVEERPAKSELRSAVVNLPQLTDFNVDRFDNIKNDALKITAKTYIEYLAREVSRRTRTEVTSEQIVRWLVKQSLIDLGSGRTADFVSILRQLGSENSYAFDAAFTDDDLSNNDYLVRGLIQKPWRVRKGRVKIADQFRIITSFFVLGSEVPTVSAYQTFWSAESRSVDYDAFIQRLKENLRPDGFALFAVGANGNPKLLNQLRQQGFKAHEFLKGGNWFVSYSDFDSMMDRISQEFEVSTEVALAGTRAELRSATLIGDLLVFAAGFIALVQNGLLFKIHSLYKLIEIDDALVRLNHFYAEFTTGPPAGISNEISNWTKAVQTLRQQLNRVSSANLFTVYRFSSEVSKLRTQVVRALRDAELFHPSGARLSRFQAFRTLVLSIKHRRQYLDLFLSDIVVSRVISLIPDFKSGRSELRLAGDDDSAYLRTSMDVSRLPSSAMSVFNSWRTSLISTFNSWRTSLISFFKFFSTESIFESSDDTFESRDVTLPSSDDTFKSSDVTFESSDVTFESSDPTLPSRDVTLPSKVFTSLDSFETASSTLPTLSFVTWVTTSSISSLLEFPWTSTSIFSSLLSSPVWPSAIALMSFLRLSTSVPTSVAVNESVSLAGLFGFSFFMSVLLVKNFLNEGEQNIRFLPFFVKLINLQSNILNTAQIKRGTFISNSRSELRTLTGQSYIEKRVVVTDALKRPNSAMNSTVTLPDGSTLNVNDVFKIIYNDPKRPEKIIELLAKNGFEFYTAIKNVPTGTHITLLLRRSELRKSSESAGALQIPILRRTVIAFLIAAGASRLAYRYLSENLTIGAVAGVLSIVVVWWYLTKLSSRSSDAQISTETKDRSELRVRLSTALASIEDDLLNALQIFEAGRLPKADIADIESVHMMAYSNVKSSLNTIQSWRQMLFGSTVTVKSIVSILTALDLSRRNLKELTRLMSEYDQAAQEVLAHINRAAEKLNKLNLSSWGQPKSQSELRRPEEQVPLIRDVLVNVSGSASYTRSPVNFNSLTSLQALAHIAQQLKDDIEAWQYLKSVTLILKDSPSIQFDVSAQDTLLELMENQDSQKKPEDVGTVILHFSDEIIFTQLESDFRPDLAALPRSELRSVEEASDLRQRLQAKINKPGWSVAEVHLVDFDNILSKITDVKLESDRESPLIAIYLELLSETPNEKLIAQHLRNLDENILPVLRNRGDARAHFMPTGDRWVLYLLSFPVQSDLFLHLVRAASRIDTLKESAILLYGLNGPHLRYLFDQDDNDIAPFLLSVLLPELQNAMDQFKNHRDDHEAKSRLEYLIRIFLNGSFVYNTSIDTFGEKFILDHWLNKLDSVPFDEIEGRKVVRQTIRLAANDFPELLRNHDGSLPPYLRIEYGDFGSEAILHFIDHYSKMPNFEFDSVTIDQLASGGYPGRLISNNGFHLALEAQRVHLLKLAGINPDEFLARASKPASASQSELRGNKYLKMSVDQLIEEMGKIKDKSVQAVENLGHAVLERAKDQPIYTIQSLPEPILAIIHDSKVAKTNYFVNALIAVLFRLTGVSGTSLHGLIDTLKDLILGGLVRDSSDFDGLIPLIQSDDSLSKNQERLEQYKSFLIEFNRLVQHLEKDLPSDEEIDSLILETGEMLEREELIKARQKELRQKRAEMIVRSIEFRLGGTLPIDRETQNRFNQWLIHALGDSLELDSEVQKEIEEAVNNLFKIISDRYEDESYFKILHLGNLYFGDLETGAQLFEIQRQQISVLTEGFPDWFTEKDKQFYFFRSGIRDVTAIMALERHHYRRKVVFLDSLGRIVHDPEVIGAVREELMKLSDFGVQRGSDFSILESDTATDNFMVSSERGLPEQDSFTVNSPILIIRRSPDDLNIPQLLAYRIGNRLAQKMLRNLGFNMGMLPTLTDDRIAHRLSLLHEFLDSDSAAEQIEVGFSYIFRQESEALKEAGKNFPSELFKRLEQGGNDPNRIPLLFNEITPASIRNDPAVQRARARIINLIKGLRPRSELREVVDANAVLSNARTIIESIRSIHSPQLVHVRIPAAFWNLPEGERRQKLQSAFEVLRNVVKFNPEISFQFEEKLTTRRNELARARNVLVNRNDPVSAQLVKQLSFVESVQASDAVPNLDITGEMIPTANQSTVTFDAAKYFEGDLPIEFSGEEAVGLQDILLAALQLLASQSVEGIVKQSPDSNTFLARNRETFSMIEFAIHALAVEARAELQHSAAA